MFVGLRSQRFFALNRCCGLQISSGGLANIASRWLTIRLLATFGDGRESSIVAVEGHDAGLTSLVPLLALLHRAEAVLDSSLAVGAGCRMSSTDGWESDATVSIAA
jgi:hypothetical protein